MGSGYRVFTAGEVLTASNVQNFLQNQSVMSFADSTARATSIGTANFEEGMLSYLQDSDTLEVYDGSAWGNIAPASTSGLTLISTTSFSAVASVQFPDGIMTSTYNHYRVLFNAEQNTSTGQTGWRWRLAGVDQTAITYKFGGVLIGISNASTRVNQTAQTSNYHSQTTTAGNNIIYDIVFSRIAGGAMRGFMNSSSTNTGDLQSVQLGNDSASAFDSIKFITSAGTLTGTMSIYGFNF
jgi:hypothetical protein